MLKHINDGDYDYQTIEINGMKLSDPKQLYSLIYRVWEIFLIFRTFFFLSFDD